MSSPTPPPLPPRVASEIIINSDAPGIKTFLLNSLVMGKVFGRIEHKEPGRTHVAVQGNQLLVSSYVSSWLNLIPEKFDKDATMEYTEPKPVPIGEHLKNACVAETPAELKRTLSSGFFQESSIEEELSLGASANTENFKKIVSRFLNSTYGLVKTGARATGIRSVGPLTLAEERFVGLRHWSKPAVRFLDVASFVTLEGLYDAVRMKLELVDQVKALFLRANGYLTEITNVAELKADCVYDVYTINDKLPTEEKFSDMDEFFAELKKQQGLDDDEIAIIKDVFTEQHIKFQALPYLTDADLKEDGISQRGLRKAILAVLGK